MKKKEEKNFKLKDMECLLKVVLDTLLITELINAINHPPLHDLDGRLSEENGWYFNFDDIEVVEDLEGFINF